MKNTINRLISVAVSAIMLFCTPVSGVSAAELGTYDAVVSIVYPRPDEAAQKPVITESGTEIELLGCFWEERSTGYAKVYDHPVLTWMMGVEGFVGYNGYFTAFTDADQYNIAVLEKIENYTGLSSNEGVATFVDADTDETIDTCNVQVISVSAKQAQNFQSQWARQTQEVPTVSPTSCTLRIRECMMRRKNIIGFLVIKDEKFPARDRELFFRAVI